MNQVAQDVNDNNHPVESGGHPVEFRDISVIQLTKSNEIVVVADNATVTVSDKGVTAHKEMREWNWPFPEITEIDGKLDNAVATSVVASIAEGCKQAGCALIGGETAEMPGMYSEGDYDLAGFCVGAVERDQVLTADKVAAGDVILGLASSGVHSNGFSLVRRLAADKGWKLDRPAIFDQNVILIDALMAPTRIYVKSLLPMVRTGKIHAMAHITGGGLLENIPRILPAGLHAHVNADAWAQPRLMAFLQAQGHIEPEEMARTFNCGIGMAVVVASADVADVTAALEATGETVFNIGHILDGGKGCTVTGSVETWSAQSDWTATYHG